ncbi:flavin reductase family protein [Streptomyces sp. TRM 70351]|uniref:flavin reductase family protein n=1 Tax=Streptomyces sp. TRM 70351 TaxID=3116552 RepID=UPI002E7B7C56|nr:flavin reductase family protein [Streptomyces sp. TRM 70351]MEE1931078.1 flavin reductase family protein [Streptomyces sp. TRM 70351]
MTAEVQEMPVTGVLPSVDLQTFRQVMGSFASGITIVTTLDDEGQPRGLTCSAFCSVSVDPPLLLNSVASRSGTLEAITARGRFAVNMLGSQGQAVSQLFASGARDKFERVRWEPGTASGMPLLRGTVAYAECELERTVPAGDHVLLLGRVVGGGTEQDRLPLTYWRGGYARLLQSAARKPVPA